MPGHDDLDPNWVQRAEALQVSPIWCQWSEYPHFLLLYSLSVSLLCACKHLGWVCNMAGEIYPLVCAWLCFCLEPWVFITTGYSNHSFQPRELPSIIQDSAGILPNSPGLAYFSPKHHHHVLKHH